MSKTKQITKTGIQTIKQKDTWKKVAAIAGGTMLAGVGVAVSNKLVGTVSTNRTLKFTCGTVAAGAVAMTCFGLGHNNLGYGAASTTAVQALNTGTSLILKQSLTELMS